MIAHGKKRILALSGGGVRGIVEVAFLEAIERAFKQRIGQETRLCDVFHLIGGTSTGSLIATALSLGLPLSTIRDFYLDRAAKFFENRRWLPSIRQVSAFDGDALEAEFIATIGDISLGDPAFQSFFAVITKRLDTGQPWLLSNVPSARYFNDPDDGSYIGNRHFRVARLLRAATATPTFFSQSQIRIGPRQTGVFVDGGLSPYNDPSLLLLKLARLKCFGLEWAAGRDNLAILSLGSGSFRPEINPATAARLGPIPLAYHALRGMISNAEQHTTAMMQWLGTSPRPVRINSEIGTLEDDTLLGVPAFTYLRLDLPLEQSELNAVGISMSKKDLRRFQRLDDPQVIKPIYQLAQAYVTAALDVDALLGEGFF